jgi:hypothetical protein
MITDYQNLQEIVSAIRTLTNDYTFNMPHPMEINYYVLSLLKIKSYQLDLSQKVKNVTAINSEKELKDLMPYY